MFPLNRDKILFISLLFAATLSVISLCCILLFLFVESLPVLTTLNVEKYFVDESWHPTEGEFFLLPMILGSVYMMIGAMLLSVPLGIMSAILCQYYAPRWFAIMFQRVTEILAGIPSVVYGFWGIMIIVPLLAGIQAPGTSLLAGILVLTLIVMPNITLIAYHTFQQVSPSQTQNAIALGLSRYSIIRHIIFPQAKQGLLTGTILQSGRAIGETLAVLMVCGNVVQIPTNLFEPVRTLTSNIALEMAYAMDTHRSALFLSGFLLMLVVLLLVYLADKGQMKQPIS